jgi:hypothetical protein
MMHTRPHGKRANATTTTDSQYNSRDVNNMQTPQTRSSASPRWRHGNTPAAAKKHSLVWRDEHAAHQRPRDATATTNRHDTAHGTLAVVARASSSRAMMTNCKGYTPHNAVRWTSDTPAALLSSAILHNFCKRQTSGACATMASGVFAAVPAAPSRH